MSTNFGTREPIWQCNNRCTLHDRNINVGTNLHKRSTLPTDSRVTHTILTPYQTNTNEKNNPMSQLSITLPDGSTIPAKDSEELAELTQNAKQHHAIPDPHAVAIAVLVHRQMPTGTATILYGSRATGTQRNDPANPSDIDLMIVTDHFGRWRNNQGIEIFAALTGETFTQQAYGQEIPVEALCHTTEEFNQLLEFRNTGPTEAIINGLIISDKPVPWHSPYTGPEPQHPRYLWSIYRHYLDSTADNIKSMASVLFGFPVTNGELLSIIISALESEPDEAKRHNMELRYIKANAISGIADAHRCIIAASGALPGKNTPIDVLNLQVRQMLQDRMPNLNISTDQYQDLLEQKELTDEQITITATEDIEALRTAAKSVRRRTQRQHPGSLETI